MHQFQTRAGVAAGNRTSGRLFRSEQSRLNRLAAKSGGPTSKVTVMDRAGPGSGADEGSPHHALFTFQILIE